MKSKHLKLITLLVMVLTFKSTAEEIVKRNIGVEISNYQSPNKAKEIVVSLILKDTGKSTVTGELNIQTTKRLAELTIKGQIKDNVLHFTFQDATSGASGTGVIYGDTPQSVQVKFTEFTSFGDGSTASLLGKHKLIKKTLKKH